MLKQQLTEFLNSDSIYIRTLMYGTITYDIFDVIDNLTIVELDSYGGEDQGTTFYHIWEFSTPTEKFFIKFFGDYYSHVGVENEDYEFVKPVQKIITVYE